METLALPALSNRAWVRELVEVCSYLICAAALEAGKHVICDKPMALNGQEAEQMLEAARQHPGQVGDNLCLHSACGMIAHVTGGCT